MANRRRADSGEPVGTEDGRGRRSDSGSDRGKLRKRRASSVTSLEIDEAAAFPDHVEQVAVLAGCRVGPLTRRPLASVAAFSRTNIERPVVFLTSPTCQ